MSVGLSFLRAVLDDKECPASFLNDFGLKREYFPKSERKCLKFILKYSQKYSHLPSRRTVEVETGIDFPKIPKEPLQFWADQVRKRYTGKLISECVSDASEALRNGEEDIAFDKIKQLAGSFLGTEIDKFAAEPFSDVIDLVSDQHDKLQQRSNQDVEIPYGFPYLDFVSDGFQPGDAIALAGKTGLGKTYVCARIMNAAHAARKKVLVISMEMAKLHFARRCLALRTRLPETRIRKGMLSTLIGVKKLKREIVDIKGEVPCWILDGALSYQLEDLLLHIRALDPDLVIIDGASMLRTRKQFRGKWEGIAEAAEQVKIIAAMTNKPILGTYHVTEKGQIYGGRTIEHVASIILYLLADTESKANTNWNQIGETRIIQIGKGRYGESGRIRISYNMHHTSIEQLEVLSGRMEGKRK